MSPQTQRERNFIQEAMASNVTLINKLHELETTNVEIHEDEDVEREFQESILCVDRTEVYDVVMGTGGPASGYRVYVTVFVSDRGEVTGREVSHASAYYQDWGTQKEEMPLNSDETDRLLSMIYIEGVS